MIGNKIQMNMMFTKLINITEESLIAFQKLHLDF